MLFIIIPVYNRKLITRECILSLEPQIDSNVNVIVVDDGSVDGTSEMLRSEFPFVEVISGDGNLWWAGSINLGVEHLKDNLKSDDYIFLLNDDTIFEEDFINKVLQSISKYEFSLIGCLLVDANNKEDILDGGIIYNKIKNKFISLNKGKRIHNFPEGYNRNCDFLPGRGLIIPSDTFKKIGLFDTKNFPQTFADYDFTLRAKNAGYKLVIDYSTRVYSQNLFGSLPSNKRMNFVDFIKSFFNIKSSNNLLSIWKFGIKHFSEFKLFLPVQIIRVLFSASFLFLKTRLK